MFETIGKLSEQHMQRKYITDEDGNIIQVHSMSFYPTALKGCRVLFSPMVSGWAGGRLVGRAVGKSLSRLYLRNRKVLEVDT